MAETPITFGLDGNPEMRTGPAIAQDYLIAARDIRRERTGIHADIAVFESGVVMGRDVFNVGRHEDLVRLARAVHRRIDKDVRTAYPLEALEADLLFFCLWLSSEWETRQFQVLEYTHETVPGPLTFPLYPYVLDGGGTILFAPRESAKSYLCIIMGACIANGLSTLWKTEQRSVLYVNLERDARSMVRRDYYVARALAIERTGIRWLHARGAGMEAIARQVHAMAEPSAVVIYDSISRMGLGALNEDQTANRGADMANWASKTWLAIGHTPRDDASHVYGSSHFENAADVLIQVIKKDGDGKIGLQLKVVKANDFAKPKPQTLALDFDSQGLYAVRTTDQQEFPDMLIEQGVSRAEALVNFLRSQGSSTIEEAAEATGMHRTAVNRLFVGDHRFVKLPRREGKRAVYGLLTRAASEV